MMLWRAAALMAITFCMTVSLPPLVRRFVGQIVNQPTFRDFCTNREKWFHA
jgi:hypothetical protein